MLKFRSDINALRATAVTAVVLFHFGVEAIPGGFVGVDIFFVISGFLMTTIITSRLEGGRFNFYGFYYDRAKRIVPGLAAMCACLLVFGYFFIDPITYNKTSYSTVSVLLFYSNYIFQSWIGYFAPEAGTIWLLHTWSLSVEWQFYMLYPVLLVVAYRVFPTRTHVRAILCALTLASFVACVASSRIEPSAAFYFLPQRAWELLAGGLVALGLGPCPRRFSALALAGGLSLIAIALLWLDDTAAWPDDRTALPVVGTCLVIWAGRPAGLVTGNALVQGLGTWSYSIYLWHWPVAVGFAYFEVPDATALGKLLVLALVLSPAVAVFAWVRRDGAREPARRATFRLGPAQILAPFALAMGLALVVNTYRGLPSRRPDGIAQVEAYKTAWADWGFPKSCDGRDGSGRLRPCTLGPSGAPGTLVIGDSHAMQLYHRLVDPDRPELARPTTFLVSSGCPLLPRVEVVVDVRNCNGFVDAALRFAETADIERLVLVSSWHGYFAQGRATICFVEADGCHPRQDPPRRYEAQLDAAFADLGRRLGEFRRKGIAVVVVAATPFGAHDVPLELLKRRFWGKDMGPVEAIDRAAFSASSAAVNAKLRALTTAIDATFVDPVDFLCGPKICPTVDAQGVSYFFDRAHYRRSAVRDDKFRFYDEVVGLTLPVRASAVP